MAFNSDYFDLTNWKLTLPVDSNGNTGGTAVEVKDLVGYENANYFYDAPGGTMVFRAMAEGATTSGSKYARTELREMDGADRAAWKLSDGGTMTATLTVDSVPTKSDGEPGRIIVGQIHGQDQELVRLYWEKGTVYFNNDQAGSGNEETKFEFRNAAGEAPQISLGEKFSCKIDARDDVLTVEIQADGQVYSSTTEINSVWQSDSFYFKAGVYLGVNEGGGEGFGQTSFFGLDFGHTPGSGLAGLEESGGATPVPVPVPRPEPEAEIPDEVAEPVTPTPTPPVDGGETPDPVPSTPAVNLAGTARADDLRGSDGGETIKGRGGNDTIQGNGGDDELWGNGGRDALAGGAGNDWLKGGDGSDVFIFGQDHGHDTVNEFRKGETLVLSSDDFSSVEAAQAALRKTAGGIELVTGAESSILFTDTDLQHLRNADWVLDA